MRTIARSLLPLALVLAVAGCKDTSKDRNERRLVLFFTTDEHSQLYASWPELDDFPGATGTGALKGGVERRMTILQQQRQAVAARGDKVASLTFSSGDFSQGSLASAAWLAQSPELATMSRMGYDAVALGNHEFDLGAAALAAAIQAAGSELPLLVLSNLNNPAELAPLYGAGKPIAPWRILNASNGLRIGVVASMGVEAGTVAGAAPPNAFWGAGATTTEAQFGSVAVQVQNAIDAVRQQGVDAVVLLAHGGVGPDSMHPGEDELMAMQLRGVDVILSGHSHRFTPEPRIVLGSGKPVPVVQPMPYGRNVGKIELVFVEDGSEPRPFLDHGGTQFFDVDDRVAKTTDAAFVADLQARTLMFLEYGLDGAAATLPSFLESTLSKITGQPVWASTPGSLWNYEMGQGLTNGCKLAFDVTTASFGESNALNLDADAIRGVVSEIIPTEIGAQAFGPLRGGLLRGATSEIGFADVYHMAPLGGDPTAVRPQDMNPATNPVGVQAYLNQVPGYPLVRLNIPTVALRLVFEGTLQYGYGFSGDFFLGASGLVVHYDMTRPRIDLDSVDPANPLTALAPGWVTFMGLPDGSGGYSLVIYDTGNAAWAPAGYFNPTLVANPQVPTFRSVATTFYVAKFASTFGIPIFDSAFQPITTDAGLAGAIVRRADTSDIKDYEALGQFIRSECVANAGFLPDEYNQSVPRRVVHCPAGVCP